MRDEPDERHEPHERDARAREPSGDRHDLGDDPPAEAEAPVERPVDRFRRSAAGTVVAAGLLGLRDALEGRPEREEAAIVAEAPGGDPPPDDPIDVQLDFDDPSRSIVTIRRQPAAGPPGEPAPSEPPPTEPPPTEPPPIEPS